MSNVDDILVQKANISFVSKAMKQPLLSITKEKEITNLWKKRRDIKSLHLLINSYEKLVISVAIKFRKYGIPFGDLVQEGNIGILKAAYKFDPNIKVRFSTYAIWWVKSSIQEFVLRNWSIVRMGSTYNQKLLFFQLGRIKSKINKLSDDVSYKIKDNLAKRLKIHVSEIDSFSEQVLKKDFQLNQTNKNSDDNNKSPIEFLKDDKPLPEDILICSDIEKKRKLVLKKSLKVLNDKEKYIIQKRHLDYNSRTLESLGKNLHISKERVRQLESRAMLKLKKRINSENIKQDLI
jgi:RNA polymerase sigma-32 factor